jgi:nicotinate phosphoribosyltransferase
MLDEAGFNDTDIVASDDLNEYKIASLKDNKAAINVWGVGTQLVTAYDQPALGGVYKLAALFDEASQTWEHKMKLSETSIKVSTPGSLQLRRFSLAGENHEDASDNLKYRWSASISHLQCQ